MAPRVLKISLGDDMRRITIDLPSDAMEAYIQTLKAIVDGFGLNSIQATALQDALKYKDDEGDLCKLAAGTMEDFLELSANGSLRLFAESLPIIASMDPNNSDGSCLQALEDHMSMDDSCPLAQHWAQHWPQHLAEHCGKDHGAEEAAPLLANMLHKFASCFGSSDALGALLLHHGPLFASQLDTHQQAFDNLAASHKDATLTLVRTLREGIEPFPQFAEFQITLDKFLQDTELEGLGLTLAAFFHKLSALPKDEQEDVASAALAIVAGRITQMIPDIAQSMSCSLGDAQPSVHVHVVCDACGAAPIAGTRFKCKVCQDYDLCGSCYLQKEELHPGHDFECITEPVRAPHWPQWIGKGCHKGQGKGKAWHKGWWHAKCKGKGKHAWRHSHREHNAHESHARTRGVSSSSSSNSTSTSGSSVEHGSPKAQECATRLSARAANKTFKKACKEAKKNYKIQMKAAKQAWKQEKTAMKLERNAYKEKGHPSSAPTTSAKKIDAPTAPSAPAPETSPLQVLADMGFENIELNMELLEANRGNVWKVLEVLTCRDIQH